MKLFSLKFVVPLVAILSLLAFNLPSQDNMLLKKIIEKLDTYGSSGSPEKTYLQTDKDFYVLGDTIWFKTYMVDGITHQKSSKSRVAYVEMLNDKDSIIAKRRLFVEGTSAMGDIEIPEDLDQGSYSLRTYTNYMLNDQNIPFFQKEVLITSKRSLVMAAGNTNRPSETWHVAGKTNNEINVRFFPEGGSLVFGLPGVLGIKVTDMDGNGLALNGSIHTSEGSIVTEFESSDFGLGMVNFTPQSKKRYYASIKHDGNEKRFEIPSPMSEGYSLNIKNRGDNLLIQVSSTKANPLKETLLIGHLRGNLIFKRLGVTGDNGKYAIKLLTQELPDGVAHFTLFTLDGEPICERLVFIDHPSNDAQVSIKTDRQSFGPKEKINLDITVSDSNGQPLNGDFAMSVSTSNDQLKRGNMSLKSWLLLDSDLGGTIKNPGFFFNDGSKRTKFLLDALMLTHGWRRFIWKDILNEKETGPNSHEPEKGIMVKGITTDFYKPSKSRKTLTTFNLLDAAMQDQQPTDENGRFSFGPYIFNGNITAVLQAVDASFRPKGRQKNIAISLEEQWPVVPDMPKFKKKNTGATFPTESENLEESAIYAQSYFGEELETIKLKEVTVNHKARSRARIIEAKINKTTPYGAPNIRVFRDSIRGWESMSVVDLLSRRGVRLNKLSNSVHYAIGPLILIDGTPSNIEMTRGMRANEVIYIDVVRPYNSGAAIYGARGAGGIIAIYTNQPLIEGEGNIRKIAPIPGIKTAKITGFQKVREFYSPDYSHQSQTKTDYRTTLYWNPKIEIDKVGHSDIQFYTGDVSGSYIIKFNGITDDGRLVNSSYYIDIDSTTK